jgi:hypothetical protein
MLKAATLCWDIGKMRLRNPHGLFPRENAAKICARWQLKHAGYRTILRDEKWDTTKN